MMNRLLALCLLLAAPLWAQDAAPAPATAPASSATPAPADTAAEIAQQAAELIALLPGSSIKDPAPAGQQQAKAMEICEFFKAATKKLPQLKLDAEGQTRLGYLGYRAGFAAGNAEVMLEAARLAWDSQKPKPTDYASYSLAWSGIFAGKSADASEAMLHLINKSTEKPMQDWAKANFAVAKQCEKPLLAKLELTDGKTTIDTATLRGKAVVLLFWTGRDNSLAKELGDFKQLHDLYKSDAHFALYSFCMDGNDAANNAKYGVTWPSGFARGLRGRFTGEAVQPLTAILSPKGTVIYQGLPISRDTIFWVTQFALRQAARLAGEAPKFDEAAGPAQEPKPAQTVPQPEQKPDQTRPQPKPPVPPLSNEDAVEAENTLKMARMHMKLRMFDTARRELEGIIAKYPNSSAAAQARQMLRNF